MSFESRTSMGSVGLAMTRKRRRVLGLLAAAAAVVPAILTGASALQLSMVSGPHRTAAARPRTKLASSVSAPSARGRGRSRGPPTLAPLPPLPPLPVPGTAPGGGGGGVTSSLISQLASAALKVRLADQSGVKCDVGGGASDLLLRGEVGPVTVRGRGWRSELGLSCRGIEANVRRCRLDMGALVSRRKLVLTTPATGDALIAMNSLDFGNFITHPLMKPPALPLSRMSGETIQFSKEGVMIDPTDGGSVVFYGTYMGERWRCVLRRGSEEKRGGGRAVISVRPVDIAPEVENELAAVAADLTDAVSDFFNDMVFELDGTFLSFNDMMVTSKGDGSPSVMLALSITVKKFPSRGLTF